MNEQSPERVVYVVADDQGSLQVIDLWQILWGSRILIIIITAVFAVTSVAYSLLATQWYRAETVLIAADMESAGGLSSRLSGLGSLIGLQGSALGGSNAVESIAVLESRDFTKAFIEERNLMPVLFEDKWNPVNETWLETDVGEQPDIRDAIEMFEDTIRRVDYDSATGLVRLSIEWTSRDLAADWANSLVVRLNADMRRRALIEAERNVDYLQSEMAQTNLATLRESIGALLETEMQKLMLARGNEEFAFRIVDSAQVPKKRSRPKRVLVVIAATLLGGFVAVCFVLFRHSIRRQRGNPAKSS